MDIYKQFRNWGSWTYRFWVIAKFFRGTYELKLFLNLQI